MGRDKYECLCDAWQRRIYQRTTLAIRGGKPCNKVSQSGTPVIFMRWSVAFSMQMVTNTKSLTFLVLLGIGEYDYVPLTRS